MSKVLIIIGDAAEALDTLYPLFRVRGRADQAKICLLPLAAANQPIAACFEKAQQLELFVTILF